MLDDKYGRLIVLAAFSIVLICLLAMPGMNTPRPVRNNQLNTDVKHIEKEEQPVFTQQQKEEFTEKVQQEIANLSQQIEQENIRQIRQEETSISREEQMLNDWGLNESSLPQVEPEPQPQPEAEVKPVDKYEPVVQDLTAPQPVQPEKPKRIPNSKILSVNGKCFSAIALPKTISKEECNSTARIYSVKSCSANISRDAWAGAVIACGGTKNMPSLEDLYAIARLVYDSNYVNLLSSHYSKYASLGKYNPQDQPCEKFFYDRITYKSDIAAEYGLSETPGYTIWAGHEISPSYAQALTFNLKSVNYNSCHSRSNTQTYAMCQVKCK